VPDAPPGGVLIRIGACGVCGSDIPRIFRKGTYRFPTTPGHELAGTIVAIGEGVEGYRAGDRVAVFPLLWCGRCSACEQGRYVMCEDYDYLGSRSDGGFAEYVTAPARNLAPVPEGVSLEAAAMTEPAAVALHALRRVGTPLLHRTVAVFGAGPIGLIVGQWARAMGAATVALFDIVPAKLDLARRIGFERVFDSRTEDPRARIEALTGGQGAHVCVEAAGVPATTVQAISCARRGGSVVLLGNPSADVTLPAALISQAMRREVALLGTWNSDFSVHGDDDWRAALQAMESGVLDVESLVTHRVSLAAAWDALRMIRDQREFVSKVLVCPEAQ
jgi:L-iditol 2-dehydrogenase